MNKNEIKKRIADLIGLSSYKFASYKSVEGLELKVEGDALEVGMPIYVITPEGELPAPEGDFELDNGMKVSVKEGAISDIMTAEVAAPEVAPEAEVEIELTEATLADGTKVTNDLAADVPFEVGQNLFVIDEAGNKVQAPIGEHVTDSGIVLVVDEAGLLTSVKYPDAAAEGDLVPEDMGSLISKMTEAMEFLAEEIKKMKKDQMSLDQKFSKFAASPAAEKVRDGKNLSFASTQNAKVEALLKLKDYKNNN